VSKAKDGGPPNNVDAETRVPVETILVRRAQKGDADAFADLVRQYQRRAVSVAFRLLGNSEDASDVSQDAFVRAYRNLDQLEDPARFGAWLLRTVSNLALNFRRARATRATSELDDALANPDRLRSADGDRSLTTRRADEDGPLPRELRTAVNKALEQLPEKQRLSLILFSIEGLPQKEVAEILGCSVELVKWNVFQARQKLKELLKEHL
jgi:RNA polymerase sigma-70 factor (ECF subfamily)